MSKSNFALRESRWSIDPGPLLPLIHAYVDHLMRDDYRPNTILDHEYRARHFCFWLNQSNIDVSSVDDGILEQFARHQCQCPGYRSSSCLGIRYIEAVRQFVGFLVHAGEIPLPISKGEIIDTRILVYLEWLRRHRGLSEATIVTRRKVLCRLILALGPDPGDYDAALVRRVILEESKSRKAATMKIVVSTLRSYLRFLVVHGECQPWLDESVPSIVHWRHSNLPHYLPTEKVEHLIDSCDVSTPAGRRDRAVLLLLARLGLRAKDIVKLCLSDIDWKESTIDVCGKGRHSQRLPLPQDAGDALLDYLSNVRPNASHQQVFLRILAPYAPFTDSSAVTTIVSRALTRAGIADAPSRGAHLLRHSAATTMLRSGATLDMVSAVLRHSSTDMTSYYAKVDVAALQQVAQPWPGGASC